MKTTKIITAVVMILATALFLCTAAYPEDAGYEMIIWEQDGSGRPEDQHEHNYVYMGCDPAPTCESPGEESWHCDYPGCHAAYGATVPPTGHNIVDTYVEATCTTDGYTEHYCTNCGMSYTDSYVAAYGHSFGEWGTITPASCSTDGVMERTCVMCGATESQSIPATGVHSIVDEIVPATCGSAGYTLHKCSICGYSYTDSETPALGHSFGEWTTSVEPSCNQVGTSTRTCIYCGAIESRETPATGNHQYEKSVVEATCMTGGYTEYVCSVCGASYRDNETPVAAHKYGNWTVKKPATCKDEGVEVRVCTMCKAEETRTIAATGKHRMVTTTVDPTCEEQGYTLHKCSVCGEETRDSFVGALGHRLTAKSSTATCSSDGYIDKYCIRCGVIFPHAAYSPQVPHSYSKKEFTPATRTSHGQTIYKCTWCDKIGKTSIEHYYVVTAAVPPSGNTPGYTEYTCSVCGDSYRGEYSDYCEKGVQINTTPGLTDYEKAQRVISSVDHRDGTCLTYTIRVRTMLRSCGIESETMHITSADQQARFGYTDADRAYAMRTGFYPNGIGRDHYWVRYYINGKAYEAGL